MKVTVRITEKLYKQILEDLRRPHPIAYERVGFIFAKLGRISKDELLILFCNYGQLCDDNYVLDESVGARINSAAISSAMQKILDFYQGAFHVHLHDFPGKPRPSQIDIAGIFPMIPSFQAVGPTLPHGVLLLGRDNAICYVWMPGSKEPTLAEKITIVGKVMNFYD